MFTSSIGRIVSATNQAIDTILKEDALLLEQDNVALELRLQTAVVRPICPAEDKWFNAEVLIMGSRDDGRKIVRHEDGSESFFDLQELILGESKTVEVADYLSLAKLNHDLLSYSHSLAKRIDEITELAGIKLHPFGSFTKKLERCLVDMGGSADYGNLYLANEIIKQKLLIDKIELLLIEKRILLKLNVS